MFDAVLRDAKSLAVNAEVTFPRRTFEVSFTRARPSRLAFVAWFVVSAGGCAAVTGLDRISEQDCAPLCGDAQAAKDVTTDSAGRGRRARRRRPDRRRPDDGDDARGSSRSRRDGRRAGRGFDRSAGERAESMRTRMRP